MVVVCFRKPEVVINQPRIEIYQTSARHSTRNRNEMSDAIAAILKNRCDVITAPGGMIWMKFDMDKQLSHMHKLIEA